MKSRVLPTILFLVLVNTLNGSVAYEYIDLSRSVGYFRSLLSNNGKLEIFRNLLRQKLDNGPATLRKFDLSSELHGYASKLGKVVKQLEESLKRIVAWTEEEASKYAWNPKLKAYIGNSIDLRTLEPTDPRLKDEPYYSFKVVLNQSGFHVPVEVYSGDPNVYHTLQWTEVLDSIFLTDQKLKFIYFASPTGILRVYPAFLWKNSGVDLFDIREQPWYIQGSSIPKDLLILLDTSGSMTGQSLKLANLSAQKLVEALDVNDYFAVAHFPGAKNNSLPMLVTANNESEPLCFESFVRASKRNKVRLFHDLSTLKARGYSDFAEAFRFAFSMFRNLSAIAPGDRGKGPCNRILVMITDSAFGFSDSINEALYENTDNVSVFIYALGEPVANMGEYLVKACENRGFYKYLPTVGAVSNLVQDFQEKSTRIRYGPNSRSLPAEAILHGVSDILQKDEYNGTGLMVSISMPVYNRTEKLKFLGLMGTEMSIDEMVATIPWNRLSPVGYGFAINSNGYVLFHPNLKPDYRWAEDTPYLDFLDVEFDNEGLKPLVRENLINNLKGSKIISDFIRVADEVHTYQKSREYFYEKLPNTHFGVAFVMPLYNRVSIRVPERAEIKVKLDSSGKILIGEVPILSLLSKARLQLPSRIVDKFLQSLSRNPESPANEHIPEEDEEPTNLTSTSEDQSTSSLESDALEKVQTSAIDTNSTETESLELNSSAAQTSPSPKTTLSPQTEGSESCDVNSTDCTDEPILTKRHKRHLNTDRVNATPTKRDKINGPKYISSATKNQMSLEPKSTSTGTTIPTITITTTTTTIVTSTTVTSEGIVHDTISTDTPLIDLTDTPNTPIATEVDNENTTSQPSISDAETETKSSPQASDSDSLTTESSESASNESHPTTVEDQTTTPLVPTITSTEPTEASTTTGIILDEEFIISQFYNISHFISTLQHLKPYQPDLVAQMLFELMIAELDSKQFDTDVLLKSPVVSRTVALNSGVIWTYPPNASLDFDEELHLWPNSPIYQRVFDSDSFIFWLPLKQGPVPKLESSNSNESKTQDNQTDYYFLNLTNTTELYDGSYDLSLLDFTSTMDNSTFSPDDAYKSPEIAELPIPPSVTIFTSINLGDETDAYKAGVMGITLEPTFLPSQLLAIPGCSEDSDKICYLLEDAAHIVAVNKVSLTSQVGYFLGYIDAPLMHSLITEGVYNSLKDYDFEATCKPSEDDSEATSPATHVVPSILLFTRRVLSLQMFQHLVTSVGYVSFFVIRSFFISLGTLSYGLMSEEAKDPRNEPYNCIQILYRYYPTEDKPIVDEAFIECTNCTRKWSMKHVEGTNLRIIITDPMCENCEELDSWKNERKEDPGPDVCEASHAPRYRRQLYKCHSMDNREPMAPCQACGLHVSIHVLAMVTLFNIFFINNRFVYTG